MPPETLPLNEIFDSPRLLCVFAGAEYKLGRDISHGITGTPL